MINSIKYIAIIKWENIEITKKGVVEKNDQGT